MFDISWLFEWVEDFLLSAGYWVIPLGTFLENMVIIGLATPGLLVLLLAGYYAGTGSLSFPVVVGLALIGTLMGSNTSYFLGRFIWGRYSFKHKMLQKTTQIGEVVTNRFSYFLPFYHFSGYARAFVPLAVGVSRMRFKKWIVFDVIGSVAWNIVIGLLGYLGGTYGTTIEDISKNSNLIEWIFTGVFVLWVIITWLTLRKLIREIKSDESSK